MTCRPALIALLSMSLLAGACGSQGSKDGYPELLPLDTLLAEPDLPAHAAADPDAVTQSLNSAAAALTARAATLDAPPATGANRSDEARAAALRARAAALRANGAAAGEDENATPAPGDEAAAPRH